MRILVVEDERRIADTIKKGLLQEKYVVDVAYNGLEGYDLASSEEYDLILLDIMLPGMDGLTLCRNLRKSSIHTPILLLTAKAQIEERVEGLDAGADDYLTKPFSFDELLARIRALTRRPREAVNDLLSISDLTLNPKTFEVKRNKHDVVLSNKEFALLEFMLRHKKKILTKEQIINHVWNYDSDILPNTLEVTIRNLRKKIEDPFPNLKKLIYTSRGFGYKLDG